MNEHITLPHIGIIMVLIGTIILGFSTKTKEQKGIALQILEEDGKIIKPNQTYIDKDLFWLGLEFIALGSFLQW
jgi:hypothetical protein